MDRYPILYAAIDRLAEKALLHKRVVDNVFRGVRLGVPGAEGPDVSGVFAVVDTDDTPYSFSFGSGITEFPGAGWMDRDEDGTLASEERLVVNVAEAGPSGAIFSAGATSVSIAAAGLAVSDWEPLSVSPIQYSIDSPTGGSAQFGLIQRQTR